MKTKCVLACVVAILAAVSVVRADPYTVADFDGTGNPFRIGDSAVGREPPSLRSMVPQSELAPIGWKSTWAT